MTATELRKKTEKDLHDFVAEKRDDLLRIIREKRVNEQADVHEARGIRKDIAKALTVINEQRKAREESKEN